MKTEVVPVGNLKPHPRNYRNHGDEQLEHIVASIKANGFYRNVVCARDGTILAGHGVVLAARKMGIGEVTVVRLPVAPESAEATATMVRLWPGIVTAQVKPSGRVDCKINWRAFK